MGRLKQLLTVAEQPAVCCCLHALGRAGIKDIVVVLGHGADEIMNFVGPSVKVVINKDPESQMADSVRLGLRAVDPASKGVLVCLADHPLVSAGTIGSILSMHQRMPGSIIIPQHGGRRGHPTLFPGSLLAGMGAGENLRDLVRRHESLHVLLPVEDEGVVLDMDTEEDYRRLADLAGTRGCGSSIIAEGPTFPGATEPE